MVASKSHLSICEAEAGKLSEVKGQPRKCSQEQAIKKTLPQKTKGTQPCENSNYRVLRVVGNLGGQSGTPGRRSASGGAAPTRLAHGACWWCI